MGKKIQWHPAFIAAMNLEFRENRNDLSFYEEYNLNTRPLEIDLLIIRKQPFANISNDIGEIFKGHNLIEYKSPEDKLDIDVIYKTIAYASLYKSYGETVDAIKADDITITIIRETKPKKLLRYFRNQGIEVTNPHNGVYRIANGVLFSMQIIVTMELEKDTHQWIKYLSCKMDEQDMQKLLEESGKLDSRQDREYAESVLEVGIKANPQVFERIRRRDSMLSKEAIDIVRPWCMSILEPELLEKDREIAEAVKAIKDERERAEKAEKDNRERAEKAERRVREKGIHSLTSVCQEFGVSFADTVKRVAEDFELSETEAHAKVAEYWR